MHTYHIVVSQGSVILGVYGASILSMAQECARKVERETGLPAFVHTYKGDRPYVGEVFVPIA